MTPRLVRFDLDYLCGLLRASGDLDDAQIARAHAEERAVRAALLAERVRGLDRRRASRHDVGPSEVLAHLRFASPRTGREVDEDLIMRLVAADADLPFERPDPLALNAELIASTMPRAFARHHNCVPLRRDDGAPVIALNNPFDVQLVEQLQTLTRGQARLVVSPRADIQRIITEIYGFRSSIRAAEQEHTGAQRLGNLEQLTRLSSVENLEADDRPVVNAVEYLLHYALNERASDIHIEPKRDRSVVRLRIDGVLHNIHTLPSGVHAPFVSRLKGLARMDIAEKRRPQDGRIKTERGGQEVELRVSCLPVAFGEKMVIRIFDPQSLIQDLASVGMSESDRRTWSRFVGRPHGMILVTGPTGSGKTTTLYSTLKDLAGPDVNITTVEDPIEMVYEEFNQVLVQRRIEVTFAAALRSILRQDPDVIMIGEVRDSETASMATQAALTGHLVLSTLHTNDTASAVTRLDDLGVEPFLLGSTLVGVMAQRLLRRVCGSCSRQTELSEEQIDLLGLPEEARRRGALPVRYGEGCARCRQTGYFGRTGVFEMLEIEASVRELIRERAPAPRIYAAARANGMMSLRESAVYKMARGETTFEEVMGVISET